MNYAQDWTIRIYEEQKNWRYWSFLTLTYDNNHIPFPSDVTLDGVVLNSLNKADVFKYLKVLKQKCKRHGIDFRYFGCSEYGSHTLRPHYHVMLMYNDSQVVEFARQLWTYGFTYLSRDKTTHSYVLQKTFAPVGAVSYVTKYACKESYKDFYDKLGRWKFSQLERPCRFMSRRLGDSYVLSDRFWDLCDLAYNNRVTDIDEFADKFRYPLPNADGSIRYCPLPRYYANKILKYIYTDESKIKRTLSPDNVLVEEPAKSIKNRVVGLVNNHRIRSDNNRRLPALLQINGPRAFSLLEGMDTEQVAEREKICQSIFSQQSNSSVF